MKIKFSHNYAKIAGCKKAKLIEVVNVRLESLSDEFIKYDTDNGMFELPKKGDYMMLIFLKEGIEEKNLFTTIRRRTDEKEKYYRSAIGNVFNLEVML